MTKTGDDKGGRERRGRTRKDGAVKGSSARRARESDEGPARLNGNPTVKHGAEAKDPADAIAKLCSRASLEAHVDVYKASQGELAPLEQDASRFERAARKLIEAVAELDALSSPLLQPADEHLCARIIVEVATALRTGAVLPSQFVSPLSTFVGTLLPVQPTRRELARDLALRTFLALDAQKWRGEVSKSDPRRKAFEAFTAAAQHITGTPPVRGWRARAFVNLVEWARQLDGSYGAFRLFLGGVAGRFHRSLMPDEQARALFERLDTRMKGATEAKRKALVKQVLRAHGIDTRGIENAEHNREKRAAERVHTGL